jgi:hypothetical protein
MNTKTQFNYPLAFRLALLSNALLLVSGLFFILNSTVEATAPTPPTLETVPKGSDGSRVDYHLYMTRTSDTVFVFCYPGYRAKLSNVGNKQALQCNQPNPMP